MLSRNIEIKARLESVDAITNKVAALASEGPVEIAQDDTFFHCKNGRLKLRALSATDGRLIFYRRADQQGPKESFFVCSSTEDPTGLRECLGLAYGQVGRVVKHRTLYRVGRIRVHLDRVQGLGHFMELEVVLEDHEPSELGVMEAHALMAQLGIAPTQLMATAYVDMLATVVPSASFTPSHTGDIP